MKVFISSDMEGTAGIVDWAQCTGDGPEARAGRCLLLDEVNAAIDGAVAAGATEIVVNDSHSVMRNLPPAELHGEASYLSGRHKPLYMMQGLDETFDAVFFVSYHASAGTSGVLSHTYNPKAIAEVRVCGTVAGESGLNALVAMHYGVPVALITGDQHVGPEAAPFCPGVEHVAVKESLTRLAAHSLHPEVACGRIRDGAERALQRLSTLGPPQIERPLQVDVDFQSADMAEMATWVCGTERTALRTVRVTDDDPLRLFRTFIAVVYLTRSIAEQG